MNNITEYSNIVNDVILVPSTKLLNDVSDVTEMASIEYVLNLSDWKYNEIKVVIIYFMLEDCGHEHLDAGRRYLYVKISDQGNEEDLDNIVGYLMDGYGHDLIVDILSSDTSQNNNILRIDLNSWQEWNDKIASEYVEYAAEFDEIEDNSTISQKDPRNRAIMLK